MSRLFSFIKLSFKYLHPNYGTAFKILFGSLVLLIVTFLLVIINIFPVLIAIIALVLCAVIAIIEFLTFILISIISERKSFVEFHIKMSRPTKESTWTIYETGSCPSLKYPYCKEEIDKFTNSTDDKAKTISDELPSGQFQMLTHMVIIKLLKSSGIEVHKTEVGSVTAGFIRTFLIGRKCPCKRNVDCKYIEPRKREMKYYYVTFQKI